MIKLKNVSYLAKADTLCLRAIMKRGVRSFKFNLSTDDMEEQSKITEVLMTFSEFNVVSMLWISNDKKLIIAIKPEKEDHEGYGEYYGRI